MELQNEQQQIEKKEVQLQEQEEQNQLQKFQELSIRKKPNIEIDFGPINAQNIEILRVLNEQVIPVKYSPAFYKQVQDQYSLYSRYTYHKDIVIGGFVCRKEIYKNPDTEQEETTLYILTIAILKLFQNYGVGTQMLKEIERLISKDESIQYIYLHVWSINKQAINFYLKNDFEIFKEIKDYYTDIDPKDGFLIRKNVQKNSFKCKEVQKSQETLKEEEYQKVQ